MKGRLRMGTVIAAGIVCYAVFGQFELSGARAEDNEAFNTLGMSTSLSGLTGLAVIESAHTLQPWKAAVSVAGVYAHSNSSPATNVYQLEGIIGLGLPGRIELAAMAPGIRLDSGGTVTGLGDVQLSGKWRFVDQRGDLWPSAALAVTGTLPTGKKDPVTLPAGQPGMGLRTVEHYGLAIKVIASAELEFTPDQYAIGLYGEGGFFFQDLDQPTEEKNGIYAVGVALPLIMRSDSPLNSPLQFLFEVNGTYKRAADQDYVALTPGLRYVGPVTVTAGFQYTVIQRAPDALGGVVQIGFVF
ncbi:MAG: hypothetical protein HY208_07570 [Nitrospirae bacterium]|nr:hypothetical protein [Nitrospirota bacterium]